MFFACRTVCLLMATLITLESSSALIAPTSDMNPICYTTTETLVPHPTKCARYYNCSGPIEPPAYQTVEKNVQECKYPQLFNADTRRCEHYSMVQCGNKFEPLGPCEYDLYQSSHSFGPPCDFNSPSCRNVSDGPHGDKYKVDSHYYHVCVNQRLVYNGACPSGPIIFNETVRMCVTQKIN